MMDEKTKELIFVWAERAALPFQGMPQEDVHEQLSVAIGTAIKAGSFIFQGLASVMFAYKWDDKNAITVELDEYEHGGDMLIIRGCEWV